MMSADIEASSICRGLLIRVHGSRVVRAATLLVIYMGRIMRYSLTNVNKNAYPHL